MKKYQLTYSKIKENDILINNIITHYNFGKKYGLTQKEICKEFNISQYTLRKIFKESNRKIYSKRVYKEDIEEIVKQYKQGIPIYNEKNYFETISGYHGLSKSTIIKYLKQQGVYNSKKEYKSKNKKNKEEIIKKEKNLEEKILYDNQIENKEITKNKELREKNFYSNPFPVTYNQNNPKKNYINFFNRLGKIAKKALITTTAGLILAGSLFFGGYKKGYYDAKMIYKEKEKINYVEKKEENPAEIKILEEIQPEKKIKSEQKKEIKTKKQNIYSSQKSKKENKSYEKKEEKGSKIPEEIKNIVELKEKENKSYEKKDEIQKEIPSKDLSLNLEKILQSDFKEVKIKKHSIYYEVLDETILFNIPEIIEVEKETLKIKYDKLKEIATKGKELFGERPIIKVWEREGIEVYGFPINTNEEIEQRGIWQINTDSNGKRIPSEYIVYNDMKTKNVSPSKPDKIINFIQLEEIINNAEKNKNFIIPQHINKDKNHLSGFVIKKDKDKKVIVQNQIYNSEKLNKSLLKSISKIGLSVAVGEIIGPGEKGINGSSQIQIPPGPHPGI
ncbi:MAG: hypothetical protein QW117_02720 [Candidatus Pacearchaeota archaeon]